MDNEKKTAEAPAAEKVAEMTVIDGGVSAGQIELWKQQHGRVLEVEVDDPAFGERHVGYFKRPDMRTMQAFSAAAKGNELKAVEVLFDNCWLGGSPQMATDAVYKMQGATELQGIFGRCTGRLKNL